MMEPACDRSAIWEGAAVCPGLTAATEATMQGEGAWSGPLALLVDGRTASASEDMVVWLRESGAARIIGERTYGAGCGYVRGGAPARLESIGWEVKMPNCTRYTSDGINEVEGIAPDVELSITKGSAQDRLRGLLAALEGSPP
jgi:C-terminal processing protease CtpA/Prc